MKYLVVIHQDSVLGQHYAQGHQTLSSGGKQHTVLLCSKVDADHPYYLHITTQKTNTAIAQTIHVPHHIVQFVVEDEGGEKRPPGFV